jgi:hypothetical protein
MISQTKTRTRANLIPNLYLEIRKIRKKNMTCAKQKSNKNLLQ